MSFTSCELATLHKESSNRRFSLLEKFKQKRFYEGVWPQVYLREQYSLSGWRISGLPVCCVAQSSNLEMRRSAAYRLCWDRGPLSGVTRAPPLLREFACGLQGTNPDCEFCWSPTKALNIGVLSEGWIKPYKAMFEGQGRSIRVTLSIQVLTFLDNINNILYI